MASGSSCPLQTSILPVFIFYSVSDLAFTSFLKHLKNFHPFSIPLLSCYGHLQIPFTLWISCLYSSPILIQLHQLSLFALSDTFHIRLSQSSLPFKNDTVSPVTSDNPSFLLLTSWHHHILRSDSPPLVLLKHAWESTKILPASCTLHRFSLSSSLSFIFQNSPDWSFCCQPLLPLQLPLTLHRAHAPLFKHYINISSEKLTIFSRHLSWSVHSLASLELTFKILPTLIWKNPQIYDLLT